jgi:hypothetical protein
MEYRRESCEGDFKDFLEKYDGMAKIGKGQFTGRAGPDLMEDS